jgi:oligosaccharide translocation protein RFT1
MSLRLTPIDRPASLIARIIFQPLEEAARLYFSQNVNPGQTVSTVDQQQPFQVLANLLRLSLTLPLVTIVFVPGLAPVLIPILLPDRYRHTSAPQILITYMTIYLPVMSLNGILEAFFTATTDASKIARQSGVMAACSLLFGATLIGFRQLRNTFPDKSSIWTGPECALVYANTLQMICRIAFAGKHALSFMSINTGSDGANRSKPGLATTSAIVVSGITMWLVAHRYETSTLVRLVSTLSLGVTCLAIL